MGKVTVTVTFTVDPKADRDIVAWMEAIPKGEKSQNIRAAIREYIGGRSGVSIADVYQAVKDLDRRLQAGAVAIRPVAGGDGDEWHEDPVAAAALDALANL